MTQTQALPPLHMRRTAFDPTRELREIRESAGVQKIVTTYGGPAYMVTRHEDIKEVLADPERFSNRRPPGFGDPGTPVVTADQRAKLTAGNLVGTDPPEHQRLRRMLTPEFTVRRLPAASAPTLRALSRELQICAGPPVSTRAPSQDYRGN